MAIFEAHGRFVAKHWLLWIVVPLVLVALLAASIKDLQVETDPESLWVPPGSRPLREEAIFNREFAPFYRVQQVVVTPAVNKTDSLLKPEYIKDLLQLSLDINAIQADIEMYSEDGKPYTDVFNYTALCNRPVPGQGCLVQNVLEYWQMDPAKILKAASTPDGILKQVQKCTVNTVDAACLSSSGIPTFANTVLGSVKYDSGNNIVSVGALVVTYLFNNYPSQQAMSEAWEDKFIDLCKQGPDRYRNLKLAFSAQESVEKELDRENNADVTTIVISYVVMFVYISFSLGKLHAVKSEVLLALSSIVLVLCSVAASVGFCSLIEVKATLIISEVIPFLVLAIGVDNLFILVNKYQDLSSSRPDDSVVDLIGSSVGRCGASITLAAMSESLAFFLGALTDMPAVRAFALFAGCAVLANYFLQMTLLVAVLTLDARRQKASRVDVVPCFMVNKETCSSRIFQGGFVKEVMKRVIAPVVLNGVFRVVLVVLFLGFLCFSIAMSPEVDVGLDQRVALPRDSYLQDYFNALDDYLQVGSPFYIVINGEEQHVDVNDHTFLQKVCSIPTFGCQKNSLSDRVSNTPYVAPGVSSWVDDFLSYAYCMYSANEPQWLDDMNMPKGDNVTRWLHDFLAVPCGDTDRPCAAYCGAPYLGDFLFGKPLDSDPRSAPVIASRLRGYHVPCRSQTEYINALKQMYDTCDAAKEDLGLPIFPYSIFYSFFYQYTYIISVLVDTALIAGGAIFVVLLLLIGSIQASFLVLLCVGSMYMDMLGVMYLWGVSINAVSVVNLCVSIGLCVEFCIHVAHSFVHSHGSRVDRAKKALISMGSNVFSGIAMTKLCGVVVLAFASSEIFTVYYFRMYLAIVILGTAHGLFLLPILLSVLGPPSLDSSSEGSSGKLGGTGPGMVEGRGRSGGSSGSGWSETVPLYGAMTPPSSHSYMDHRDQSVNYPPPHTGIKFKM